MRETWVGLSAHRVSYHRHSIELETMSDAVDLTWAMICISRDPFRQCNVNESERLDCGVLKPGEWQNHYSKTGSISESVCNVHSPPGSTARKGNEKKSYSVLVSVGCTWNIFVDQEPHDDEDDDDDEFVLCHRIRCDNYRIVLDVISFLTKHVSTLENRIHEATHFYPMIRFQVVERLSGLKVGWSGAAYGAWGAAHLSRTVLRIQL